MNTDEPTHESVRRYYGEVLQSSADLKTSACCTADSMPASLRPLLDNIHEEVQSRFYGCGSPIPPALEGAKVLDVGCGSGRDCYLVSQLVGEKGRVVGVDMTDAQLAVARKHLDYHREKFGHDNVEFHKSFIEDLSEAGIASDSIDVVISNCVINLSPDKERVFREIFRVLKPGGELYFSDVFSDRRVPAHLIEDPVLRGECLGGALYLEDFRRMMARIGCHDVRLVTRSDISLDDAEIQDKVGMINFYSATIRAFKLDLEDREEDYGQTAVYQGRMADMETAFALDQAHHFPTGKPVAISSNTAAMLGNSRYAGHFELRGDRTTHYGPFQPTPVDSGCCAPACC